MTRVKVFDFDDTLVRTDALIYIKHRDGSEDALSPGSFASYHKKPGDEFDFRDFRKNLINPRAIRYYIEILKNVLKFGGNAIIMTARGDPKPIAKFLRDIGITSGVKIVAINAPSGAAAAEYKKKYIEKMITDKGVTHIEFFDDSSDNIRAVDSLKQNYPNVKIITRLVPSYHQ